MAKKKSSTRAQKAILVELTAVAQYGDGFEDAWELIECVGIPFVNNPLVRKAIQRNGWAEYYTDDFGDECIRLTESGYAIGLAEVEKYGSPNEAFNVNRQLNS